MERSSELGAHPGIVKLAWADLLALRPVFALVAAWLTTAGHTASFREMFAAHGWVLAEGYSLHSIFLLAITLTLLVAPRVARWSGSYPLVVAGLAMLGVGSLVNGMIPPTPRELLVVGRVLAGIGAGLVIRSAPRILPAGQEGRIAWAGIVLPAAGPVVMALAVEWSPWWSWQGAFLFEVVLALLSLALVLSMADPPDVDRDSPRGPAQRLDYFPAVVVFALAVWYVMHWGQLHGWLEGPDITIAMIVGSVALSVLVWIVWPGVDAGTLREGLPRLGLIAYGGFVQYFNSLDMGIYGALLVNFSPWMRSWLIWSLTIGSTTALALGRIVWQKRSPGFAGAALGIDRAGRGNGPVPPQHHELAVLARAQYCRVQLVRRSPALAARAGAVLDGLWQRDGPAGDDDSYQPRSFARSTNRPVAPGRTVRGRNVKRRSSRDGAPGQSPGSVLLCRRPGFHPDRRARRSELAACRPPGHDRRDRAGTTGRSS